MSSIIEEYVSHKCRGFYFYPQIVLDPPLKETGLPFYPYNKITFSVCLQFASFVVKKYD